MSRSKRAAAEVPVPQTREEADDFIRRIGEAQIKLILIQTGLDANVATAKRTAERAAVHAGHIRDAYERVASTDGGALEVA